MQKSLYETVYVLKSSTTEDAASQIQNKISGIIASYGGELQTSDTWDLRELAFPIKKETHGRYYILVYRGESGVVGEIERILKYSPSFLRVLSIQQNLDYDYAAAKKRLLQSEDEFRKMKEARKKNQGYGGGSMSSGGGNPYNQEM